MLGSTNKEAPRILALGIQGESEMLREFDNQFHGWVRSACEDWGYDVPSEEWFAKVYGRLPQGVRASLGLGLKSELVITKGRFFTMKSLPPEKGPYNWFSRYAGQREPAPNWEYFVHVAEFIRFYSIAIEHGLSVAFEDDTMDISVYCGKQLVIYCEVKERVTQIEELIRGVRSYQSYVDLTAPDRGNDPLRKAKCIVEKKPDYFVGVAIGARMEYRVMYLGNTSFTLVRDMVPLV